MFNYSCVHPPASLPHPFYGTYPVSAPPDPHSTFLPAQHSRKWTSRGCIPTWPLAFVWSQSMGSTSRTQKARSGRGWSTGSLGWLPARLNSLPCRWSLKKLHLFSESFFYFLLYFPIIIYPHYNSLPTTISTLLSMYMSPFSFLLDPSPQLPPRAVSLLSMSVSILLVSLFCSLDSTCEWNHMVFVFSWLVYFTEHNVLQIHSCCHKG